VVVVLRTAKQLAKVIEGNPFSTAEPGQLHVTFLAQKPSRAEQADLAKGSYPPDEFRIVGREVYLRCPNGYGRTKLGNQFLEKKLGVSGTTRNWRTITTLAEMAAGG